MLLKGLIVYSITLLLRRTNDRSLHYVLLKHVVTSWSSVLSKHDVHIYVPYVRHVYLISFESEKLAHISLPPEFPRGGHIAILVSSLSRICQLFHLDTKRRTLFFPFDLHKTYTMHTHRLRFKSIFFLFIFHYTPHNEVCPSVCRQNPMSYDNLSCVSYNLLKFISCLLVKWGWSLSFLTIFTFALPELLDLIWRKIGCLPYVVW